MLTSHQPSPPISRRTALTRGGGVLATLLAAGTPGFAQAQSSPAASSEGPNTYSLTGDGVEIGYASTSFDGQPTLWYRIAGDTFEFRGKQITTEPGTTLGNLVSVMVDVAHDAYIDYLTILLPPINLRDGNEPAPFSTMAICSRHRTTVGGPKMVDGPVIGYRAHLLEGTAELLHY